MYRGVGQSVDEAYDCPRPLSVLIVEKYWPNKRCGEWSNCSPPAVFTQFSGFSSNNNQSHLRRDIVAIVKVTSDKVCK